MKDTIIGYWIKRRERLVHDYSLVGCMLSPNSIIMDNCAEHKCVIHDHAAKRLVEKLILDPLLVGHARKTQLAVLIDKFKDEYLDFKNKIGAFNKDNIWIMAEQENQLAYKWHQKYTLESTTVLGKLACFVLSKILGIGTAERNWKQVKKVKKGDHAKTGVEKTSKQVLVYSQYQMQCGLMRKSAHSSAGKLWDDSNFSSMKMDVYCKDLEEEVDADPEFHIQVKRIAKIWQERWVVPKFPGVEEVRS